MRIPVLFLRLVCVASVVQGFLQGSTKKQPPPFTISALSVTKKNQGIDIGTDRCDVAVFGGGFGGLYTALAISREARARGRPLDVALVEPSDQFVFLPLLYDLTVGTASEAEVCPSYKDILDGTGIRHVKAKFDCFSSPDLFSANLTTSSSSATSCLSFRTSVIAVGATPESILASVPGATQYAQPFYTQENARETRELLTNLEVQVKEGHTPRIAIIGGGYAGVELAACVKRRIPKSAVSLLTRGAPMKGTRGEDLVNKALKRLGVQTEVCSVESLAAADASNSELFKSTPVFIFRSALGSESSSEGITFDEPWDAVLWTAGSGPAYPVSNEMEGLEKVESGRLAIDSTLRCIWKKGGDSSPRELLRMPPVWALGDCAEITDSRVVGQPAVPKTAQAAMQQADTVALNVLAALQNSKKEAKTFQYQDLGSMLSLGGPNAAVLAPRDDSPLAPIFSPLLDISRMGLGIADEIFVQLSKSKVAERVGVTPAIVESLGLSLGGYGLGVDPDIGPGTLSGTLAGAARRAVYAARMPTGRQRAYAFTSAAISTAASLAKEAASQLEKNNNNGDSTE